MKQIEKRNRCNTNNRKEKIEIDGNRIEDIRNTCKSNKWSN